MGTRRGLRTICPRFASAGPRRRNGRNRTEADAAIEWEATVTEVARAAGAQRWDDDEVKRFFADIGPADGAWVSEHETVYRLWFLERASARPA